MDADNPDSNPEPALGETFYSGAVSRIRRFMIGLGLLLSAVAALRFGRWSALGFACGCVIAYLNFHWLKGGVAGLADRITNTGEPQSGKAIVARFPLRSFFIGAPPVV